MADVSDLIWASLKEYHNGDLMPAEGALLADPETQLSASAKGHCETREFENYESHDP